MAAPKKLPAPSSQMKELQISIGTAYLASKMTLAELARNPNNLKGVQLLTSPPPAPALMFTCQ
jgi:hypothetical protein